MKRIIVILSLLGVFLLPATATAQLIGDSSAYDETLWGMKKRKMVMENMDLSEAEKAAFWPVYENYAFAVRNIDTETLQIIVAINDHASGLHQHDLEKYSKRLLQNELILDRMRISYYKKFSKALSPSRANQFMQMDDNLRMMLRFEVQRNVEISNETQASIR
jgi:hypothetical protein